MTATSPESLCSAAVTKSCSQSWPPSQPGILDGPLLHLKLTGGIRWQPRRSLPPRACRTSASSLDEEGDNESQFPFVLMANNLENSPCLLRTVNDASEITSEIVIKENGRRERDIRTRCLITDASASCEVLEQTAASPSPQGDRRTPESILSSRGSGVQPPSPVHPVLLSSYKASGSSTPGIQELEGPRT